MTTLSTALRRRLRAVSADSDRGSLPMLILVIIATAALGAIMMSVVLTSTQTSENAQARVLSLQAAESGISAVVGQLRSAVTSNSAVGEAGRLPCGPFTSGQGSSAANSGVLPASDQGTTTSYTVTIAYYDTDPSVLGTSDLTNSTNRGGKQMLCTGAGPYNSIDSIRTPKYALLTSVGKATGARSSTRTLQTTYNFQVLNQNIAGGIIRLYPTSAAQWCMDAGSSPSVGTAIVLQMCSATNPPVAQQVWAYRPDLSIELVSSAPNPKSAGLCLDTGASPTAHNANDPILLQRCAVADASVCPAGQTPTSFHNANPSATCSVSPWNQQWSIDDNSHLHGAKTDATDLDTYCINASSQGSGVALTLQTCAGTIQDGKQTWVPSPSTGAGMAGPANQQLVNFQQFATCLDVTNKNVATPYLILYTCKQNPNPANVSFNQKVTPSPAPLSTGPSSVLLTFATGGVTYCLTSPQTAGGYPTLVPQGTGAGQCPMSATAAAGTGFLWTVSQRWTDNTKTAQLPYAKRYTIVDNAGRCLSPGPNTDLYLSYYSKIVVSSCTGDNSQKWNADATTSQAALTNTSEVSSG